MTKLLRYLAPWGLVLLLTGCVQATGPVTLVFVLFFIVSSFVACVDDYGGIFSRDKSAASAVSSEVSESGWVQDAYLKASDGVANDRFGEAISISGDYLAVGTSRAGKAYVFEKDSSGAWSEMAQLTSSYSPSNDFGRAISISGDYVAVGDSAKSSFTGAVHIYKRSGSAWSEDQYITITGGSTGDKFGESLDLSDDTLAIAALNENNTGVVYVFTKDAVGTWSQSARLTASNASTGDNFGTSVSIEGDYLAVTATHEDSSATVIENRDKYPVIDSTGAGGSGAVYVFKKDSAGSWSQDAYLKASNSASYTYLGESVSISGDTIVVGAVGESNSVTSIENNDGEPTVNAGAATYSGAVYVFKRESNGDWVQDAYLKASNAGSGDSFGHTVSISGDTIVVGSYAESSGSTLIENSDNLPTVDDNSSLLSGAVYVFARGSDGAWLQDAFLKASNAESNDWFGYPVVISDDVIVSGATEERDSSQTIINDDGQPLSDSNGASASGAVYIFKKAQ